MQPFTGADRPSIRLRGRNREPPENGENSKGRHKTPFLYTPINHDEPETGTGRPPYTSKSRHPGEGRG
jgi:hypothetical protein